VPCYLSKFNRRKSHVDLLLLKEGSNCHYVRIKRFVALICHRTNHQHTVYCCLHCCHPYNTLTSFNNHFLQSSRNMRQAVNYPDEEKNHVFWKSRSKTDKVPFVCYADFESV